MCRDAPERWNLPADRECADLPVLLDVERADREGDLRAADFDGREVRRCCIRRLLRCPLNLVLLLALPIRCPGRELERAESVRDLERCDERADALLVGLRDPRCADLNDERLDLVRFGDSAQASIDQVATVVIATRITRGFIRRMAFIPFLLFDVMLSKLNIFTHVNCSLMLIILHSPIECNSFAPEVVCSPCSRDAFSSRDVDHTLSLELSIVARVRLVKAPRNVQHAMLCHLCPCDVARESTTDLRVTEVLHTSSRFCATDVA